VQGPESRARRAEVGVVITRRTLEEKSVKHRKSVSPVWSHQEGKMWSNEEEGDKGGGRGRGEGKEREG